MPISERGLAFIKGQEGLRLHAYLCPAGVWTIGYGHTGPDVREAMTIDERQADALLRRDVKVAEVAVGRLVEVPLSQGQLDALTSFVMNAGPGSLQMSTLLRKLNQHDYLGAAGEFPRWNKARDPRSGQLRELAGLTKRRLAEQAMFSEGLLA